MAWVDEQTWEANWWSNCVNTFWEETKQLVYAKKMGLVAEMVDGKYPVFDLKGKSVLDVGGGPVSLLLKCVNFETATVIDPCPYPRWVDERYRVAKINYIVEKGEDLKHGKYDEIWIYNVLQHTENPEEVIKRAKKAGKIIRLFEWVNIPISEGHPHELKAELLDKWLGGTGKVEQLNESGCHGTAYYGIFLGDNV